MKKTNHHILHKVNLDINSPEEKTAFEIKSRLDSFLRKELFPKIEKLFDQMTLDDEIKRFESIQMDFEMKHANDIDLLANQFIAQLKEKLEQIDSEPLNFHKDWDKIENQHLAHHKPKQYSTYNPNQNTEEIGKKVSHDSNLKNTFIHFLETGQLPWYAVSDLLTEFVLPVHFSKALRDNRFVLHLNELFLLNENALNRFIYQFDNETIKLYIKRLMRENKMPFKDITDLISKQDQTIKKLIYKLLIMRMTNNHYAESKVFFQQIFKAISVNNSFPIDEERHYHEIHEIFQLAFLSPQPELTHQENPQSQIIGNELAATNTDMFKEASFELKDPIYISNAGIILCHPFLPELFKRCGCINENSFVSPEMQQYAIHLLHFLGSGKEHDMEYNLGFEKFLCGIQQNTPIDRTIILQDVHKEECQNVIISMIGNWTALKNTSSDGLRSSFFMREGKLDLMKSPVRLYIERQTVDILLDRLPWNYSIVKIPWLSDILYVEW